jgi:hypothetical protein
MADLFDGELEANTGSASAPRVAYRRLFFYHDGARNPEGRCQFHVREDHQWEITEEEVPLSVDWVPIPVAQQAPVNLLIYCHGVGGDEANFDVSRSKTTRNMMMERGDFIVLQSNAGGPNWGNQPALSDYHAAYDLARRLFNVKYVFTYGQSMGGFPALLLKVKEGLPVLGNIHLAGWTDLEKGWEQYGGPQTAYSISPNTEPQFQIATAGHDPLNDYVAADYDDFFFRAYASEDDIATIKEENADAFAAMIASVAQESEVVGASGGDFGAQPVTGAHLSNSHYQPSDVSAFLDRAIAWADAGGIDPPPPPDPGDLVLAALYWSDGVSLTPVRLQRHLGGGIMENVDILIPAPE